MPSRALHVQQATRNVEAIKHLLASDQDGTRQWAVIAAFYCALHCIEVWFADRNEHYFSHEKRRNALADHGPGGSIYAAYLLLENRAYHARYSFKTFSRPEVDLLVKDYLAPIRKLAGV